VFFKRRVFFFFLLVYRNSMTRHSNDSKSAGCVSYIILYIIYFSSFAACVIGTRVTCTAVINFQGPTKTGGCHRRRCVEVGLSTNLRIILRAAIYIIYACRRGRNAQSHVSPGKRCENNPVNSAATLIPISVFRFILVQPVMFSPSNEK